MIDTHLHFWNPFDLEYFWLEPHSDLNRTYQPEHFDAKYRAMGVTGAVFVQATHEARTHERTPVRWACLVPLGYFPICTLTAPYRATRRTLLETLGTLNANAFHRICTANPQQIYGLEPQPQGVNL